MKNYSKEQIQVKPDLYLSEVYDTKERFISYWYQINETLKLNPKSILEIGIGNGFVSYYLKKRGFSIVTLDFDKMLEPDIVGNVLEIPFKENSFDLVTCCEVLEHLPFERFAAALNEIRRVSRKDIIISLPDAGRYYSLFIHIPYITKIQKVIPFPNILLPKNVFNGEHYWEINKETFPLSRIISHINSSGLLIKRHFPIVEFPHHHFL
jgi:SAM-dependent methyltransferase